MSDKSKWLEEKHTMGAKIAGFHFLTGEPDKLLPKLKRKFNKQPGPSEKDLGMMALLRAMAEGNIRKTASDEGERAAKQAQLDAFMANAFREVGEERAVLVLRPGAVSLYWYDHIRTENLGQEAKKYAKSLGVPALGLGLYDDDDVILCATDGKVVQRGFYWFGEEDIEPAVPAALCATLGLPDKESAVAEALQYQDAEAMVQALEQIFGVELYVDAEECRRAGREEIATWPGADVFRA